MKLNEKEARKIVNDSLMLKVLTLYTATYLFTYFGGQCYVRICDVRPVDETFFNICRRQRGSTVNYSIISGHLT